MSRPKVKPKIAASPVTANDVLSPAEIFFRDQFAHTTERGKKTLTRLREVCLELIEADEPIIVATVGRILKKRYGGPDAQSIRDQPARLRRLVELYTQFQRERNPPPPPSRQNDKDLLVQVDDLKLRAELRHVIAERDRLLDETRALRQAFKRLAPIKDLTPEQCQGPICGIPSSASPSGQANGFTDGERQAAARFLDPDFLYDEGLRIDEELGLIRDSTARLIAEVPLITALRKITGAAANNQEQPGKGSVSV